MRGRLLIAVIGALAVAAVVWAVSDKDGKPSANWWASGKGERQSVKAAARLPATPAEKAPIKIAALEVPSDCFNGTFVPGQNGLKVAKRESPPGNWRQIESQPGAVPADRAAIKMTIEPRDGQREITITGVSIKRKNGLRPPGQGAVLYHPCSRKLEGTALEFDLDQNPRLLASQASRDAAVDAPLGLRRPAAESPSRPIRFPWTLSLAHPAHLFLIVNADLYYCTWRARVHWRTKSARGTIPVDDGGKPYRVTDTLGVHWYMPGPDGQWIDARNPAKGGTN
jgi:hypothetical protein